MIDNIERPVYHTNQPSMIPSNVQQADSELSMISDISKINSKSRKLIPKPTVQEDKFVLNDVVKANVEMLEKLFYEKYRDRLKAKEIKN